ncbi:MAG: heavy metal-associated domain-containing protein [Spongiibacteraceae bacterium]
MKMIAAIILLSVTAAAQATQTITAQVNGMVCAFCAQGIEKKARELPQTQDVYVNLKQKIVAIEIKEGQSLSADTVSSLVKNAGYDVTHLETVNETVAAIRGRLEQK